MLSKDAITANKTRTMSSPALNAISNSGQLMTIRSALPVNTLGNIGMDKTATPAEMISPSAIIVLTKMENLNVLNATARMDQLNSLSRTCLTIQL